MFRSRLRLQGMEFVACQSCNQATSTADLVAGFMARLRMEDGPHWQNDEAKKLLAAIKQQVPELWREIFWRDEKAEEIWVRGSNGLIRPLVRIQADGPVLQGYLNTFSAKLAMALFREHIGEALPLAGRVMHRWFLNGGLAQTTADTMLRILPASGTLRQGRKEHGEQFTYRYNTDDKSILAALVGFHSNLHVLVVAMSEPEHYGVLKTWPGAVWSGPGRLLDSMPARRSSSSGSEA
ncbi:hypothetical protein ACLF3G_03240 [Falsiroseomonas sp. HC035]|uniref:hypothetical protein n=1 Tax=Falsiroseomonas sp. HC035 TaxID=3390999 RepID=UPI003D31E78D